MTLNEALILSYIRRGIGYGYKILTHVRDSRSDEWVDFSRAGLYKTLDKLEKKGFVRKKMERTGGRPEKKVYSISPQGQKALEEFLTHGFHFNYQVKDDLDMYLVIAVAASLDASVLGEKVRTRILSVENHLRELKEEWPKDTGSYPLIVYTLYRHRLESLECELKWLNWLEGILASVSGDIINIVWKEV